MAGLLIEQRNLLNVLPATTEHMTSSVAGLTALYRDQ